MAEAEGTTGSTEEKTLQAAKQRISDGKGTADDFKLVGESLMAGAKRATDPKNLPAVGNMDPNAGKIAADWYDPKGAERIERLKNNQSPAVAQAMAGANIPAGQNVLEQFGAQPSTGNVIGAAPLGVPGGSPTANRPAPKTFTISGEMPAIAKSPATGTNGGEQSSTKPENPKMKQVSELVQGMKRMDPLTIWDILEGGLKGYIGSTDTARRRKLDQYEAARLRQEEGSAEREKMEGDRAFQQEMLGQQLGQEKELAAAQLAATQENAAATRAARWEEMGFDRETAVMLANLQAKQQRAATSTPQQIAQFAMTGGGR